MCSSSTKIHTASQDAHQTDNLDPKMMMNNYPVLISQVKPHERKRRKTCDGVREREWRVMMMEWESRMVFPFVILLTDISTRFCQFFHIIDLDLTNSIHTLLFSSSYSHAYFNSTSLKDIFILMNQSLIQSLFVALQAHLNDSFDALCMTSWVQYN